MIAILSLINHSPCTRVMNKSTTMWLIIIYCICNIQSNEIPVTTHMYIQIFKGFKFCGQPKSRFYFHGSLVITLLYYKIKELTFVDNKLTMKTATFTSLKTLYMHIQLPYINTISLLLRVHSLIVKGGTQ